MQIRLTFSIVYRLVGLRISLNCTKLNFFSLCAPRNKDPVLFDYFLWYKTKKFPILIILIGGGLPYISPSYTLPRETWSSLWKTTERNAENALFKCFPATSSRNSNELQVIPTTILQWNFVLKMAPTSWHDLGPAPVRTFSTSNGQFD